VPATLAEVATIVTAFPGVTEGARFGNRTWFVDGKGFAWERPLSKADIKRLAGAPVPDGDILAVSVEDMHEKAAVLAENRPGFFDMEHFRGYPAVLIQLSKVHKRHLKVAIEDAWLSAAPEQLAVNLLKRPRSHR
jgi:hypothetical protein